MRTALTLIGAAAVAASALTFEGAAQAQQRWPAIPPELGTGAPIERAWIPYRCDDGPVYNFYHGAYYRGEPPAIFLGYAYRRYYRYTAYRVLPRSYFCD